MCRWSFLILVLLQLAVASKHFAFDQDEDDELIRRAIALSLQDVKDDGKSKHTGPVEPSVAPNRVTVFPSKPKAVFISCEDEEDEELALAMRLSLMNLSAEPATTKTTTTTTTTTTTASIVPKKVAEEQPDKDYERELQLGIEIDDRLDSFLNGEDREKRRQLDEDYALAFRLSMEIVEDMDAKIASVLSELESDDDDLIPLFLPADRKNPYPLIHHDTPTQTALHRALYENDANQVKAILGHPKAYWEMGRVDLAIQMACHSGAAESLCAFLGHYSTRCSPVLSRLVVKEALMVRKPPLSLPKFQTQGHLNEALYGVLGMATQEIDDKAVKAILEAIPLLVVPTVVFNEVLRDYQDVEMIQAFKGRVVPDFQGMFIQSLADDTRLIGAFLECIPRNYPIPENELIA